MSKNKLVYGWGINDVEHPVTKSVFIGGKYKKIWVCPYYLDWVQMIRRCFDPIVHKNFPTYKDCTISEDWKYLTNFIKWVDSQPNKDWQNCHLDKDFLFEGNKHYSEYKVVYVEQSLNKFIIDSGGTRGDLLIGSTLSKSNKNPYQADCSNPFTGKGEYLGYFPTELEAHKAWQAKKHEHACALADIQQDERVAKRLREMYSPDKDWTNK